ncbi:hypothetical protein [Mesorhizobium sp. 14Argb]
MRWARDQARLSPEAAAEGIGISVDKLEACEVGDNQLTFPQFLAAANFYKRAPAIFYLNEPPAGFQPIQDCRSLRETPEYAFKSGLNGPFVRPASAASWRLSFVKTWASLCRRSRCRPL